MASTSTASTITTSSTISNMLTVQSNIPEQVRYQKLKRRITRLSTFLPSARTSFFYQEVEQIIQELNQLSLNQQDPQLTDQVEEDLDELYALMAQRTTSVSAAPLPRADWMKPFDGVTTRWASFAHIFREVIGDHPAGSPIYKLEILAELVPQHARQIRACKTHEEALNAIGRHYANPEAIWEDLFHEIEQLPILTENSSQSDFESIMNTALLIISTINPTEVVNRALAHRLLKAKLGYLLLPYEREARKSVEDLHQFLSSEAAAIRRVNEIRAEQRMRRPLQPSKPTPGQPAREKRGIRAISYATIQQPSAGEFEPCFFCQDTGHLRRNCPLPRTERLANASRAGLCLICLNPQEDHQCSRRSGCRCGSGLHHMICSCSVARGDTGPRNSRSSEPPPPSRATNAHWRRGTEIPTTASNSGRGTSASPHTSNIQVTSAVVEKDRPCILSEIQLPKMTYLPTLKVSVSNPTNDRKESIRSLMDTAATSSFISEAVADRLRLPKTDIAPFSIGVFGGTSKIQVCAQATVTVSSIENPDIHAEMSVFVMSGVLVGRLPTPSNEVLKKAKSLGIDLSEQDNSQEYTQVDMLVGQDLLSAHFLEPSSNCHLMNQSAFVRYRFGWAVQGILGPDSAPSPHAQTTKSVHFVHTGPPAQQCLATFPAFPETACGCQDVSKLLYDPLSDDQRPESFRADWVRQYTSTIQYNKVEKRYYVALPWYDQGRPAPNFACAHAQCLNIRPRLERENKLEEYDIALQSLVQEGYAKVLDHYQKNEGYYVPHFPIFKASSETTPLRPVFNASSAPKGQKSLNDCIFKGVWEQVQLIHVLLRWRTHPVVALADIRKAFLQIRIRPEDRQYLRFLWFQNNRVRAYEMTSLLFGATASPFILHAVLKHHFESTAPDVAHIVPNTYMDDCVLMAHSATELGGTFQRVREVMSEASFSLHKFNTIASLAPALGLEAKDGVTSCLGLHWDLQSDQLRFEPPTVPTCRLTKRILASTFAKIFDPLQLFGPFHTLVKKFFHELIPSKQGWDDEISPEATAQVQVLFRDLDHIRSCRVPRLTNRSNSLEIWIFGDASSYAYGVAAYLADFTEPEPQTSLLISRGHIASKNKTVPQLELVAAVLAAETLKTLRECLRVSTTKTRLFTDSQVTWHRIQSDPNKHEPYVANRLRRIIQETSPHDWYYIPTDQNPADLVSRGASLRILKSKNSLWFQGPAWPAVQRAELETQRLRAQSQRPLLFFVTATPGLVGDYLDRLVHETSHEKLRSALVIMITAIAKRIPLLDRFQNRSQSKPTLATLVDVTLWQLIQKHTLPQELAAAREGQPAPSGSKLGKVMLKLDPYGLLRVERRLTNSDLPTNVCSPIATLDSPAIRNYIRYVHKARACHGGVDITKHFVQQAIFLPNIDRIVRQSVKDCLTCLRYRTGPPFSAPMGPMPSFQVTAGRAFQAIGVDIAGPIKNDIGRQTKFYFLVFICLRSRAINLELLSGRETTIIMQAFKRHISTYGRPEVICSDNEGGFQKISKALLLAREKHLAACRQLQHSPEFAPVTWHFNLPECPWQGGIWERVIRTVKAAFDQVRLATAHDYESLQTVLRETQFYVNSRPLLHGSTDPVITPAHLVFGRPLDAGFPLILPQAQKEGDAFIEYQRLQRDLEGIWKIWSTLYLTSLRNHMWEGSRVPRVNELVVVRNNRLPRNKWPLATITNLRPGQDGYIRSAKIRFLDPKKGGHDSWRHIRLLVPIEPNLRGEDVSVPTQTATPSRQPDGAQR